MIAKARENPNATPARAVTPPAPAQGAERAGVAVGAGADGKVRYKTLITGSIMLATIMQALDSTIANVALPSMQGSLGAAVDTVTWVLSSYIVAAAIMTPIAGWMAARFGRRRIFLIHVAGFTIMSMMCGWATSLGEIVVYRVLQGVAGAALVPLSQSTLLDINPREKHGEAMAIWGAGIMIGPIMGPTLGGWLTENYTWRWVFYVNLPVGILAFLGILLFMPESERDTTRRFDFFGFGMLSVGIGCLQLMLDRGQLLDWFSATEICVYAALAGLGFYMVAVHSATTHTPFLQPQMMKDRNFLCGIALAFMVGIVLLATVALLPPMLQDLMAYPVITTGFIMAPRGIGTMIAMMVVGRLVTRVDLRLLMLGGLLVTAYSLWSMGNYSLDMDWWPVAWVGLIQGVGLGFVFVPLSTLTFATLPARLRTEAAAFYNLTRNVGSSVGISVVTALLARNVQINHATLASRITAENVGLWSEVMHMDLSRGAGLAALNAEITRQSAMIGYLNDFRLMCWITLLSTPLLLLIRKPSYRSAPAGHAALD
ncbi:MAG TPA: DHA2 family efflux MFS transporter permease subunit [bacterium]|nr:DHA2 family efflux MFS transporter permease subunit [bacterium]